MKPLPEILRDVILLLAAAECDHVVLARGHHAPLDSRSSAFQIRIRHAADMGLSAYRCEVSSWLGGHWSPWREQRGWLGGGGFDIHDVLAPDWRIIS